MADIIISRQNYKKTGETTDQYNGWAPNTISGAITGTTLTANTIYEIPADFKDHKTVFDVTNAGSDAATITVLAGNSYHGAKDLILSAPAGHSKFWLNSSDFVNKTTGKIQIQSSAAVTIFGYEMR